MNKSCNFSIDELSKVLKHTGSEIITFETEKCDFNENFTVIKVRESGTLKTFYLLKCETSQLPPFGNQINDLSKLVRAQFVIRDTSNQHYLAFPEQHFTDVKFPKRNDLKHLEVILESLAQYQVNYLINKENNSRFSRYDIKTIGDKGSNLEIDKSVFDKELNKLEKNFNKLLGDELVVRSIGINTGGNISVLINETGNSALFLEIEEGRLIPPAYDALWFIFLLSDENFRKVHFKELVTNYFQKLQDSLKKSKNDLGSKLTTEYNEYSIRVLLPIIKLNILNKVLEQNHKELLSNIGNFFKYPLINQEDIYETVENKLKSSDYELLGYKMTPLSETNGHLGQYYHLYINVNFHGKLQLLTLFAKFIIVPTETMEMFVKAGPAKKEHFFYSELIGLFEKNGMGQLLDFGPACYLSRVGWLVILDDLSVEGFVGLKPNNVLDYKGLSVVVGKLAKFHACSLIYEEIISKRNGKTYTFYDDFEYILNDSTYVYNDQNPFKPIFDLSRSALKYIIRQFPDLTKDLKLSEEEIYKRFDEMYMKNFEKMVRSEKHKNGLIHGDMYLGNVLLSFNKDKTVTDAILVDFQLLKYCPPTYDVLFFLHVASTKETRNKCLTKLLDEYYDHLSTHIKKFNMDPEIVYPKEGYRQSLKFMKSVALIIATEYSHVTQIDPDFREEIFHDQEKFDYYMHKNRIELINMNWSNESYKSILKGLSEDILDLIVSQDY